MDDNKFALGVKTSIYNAKLRQLRKELNLSQLQLADMLNLPRQTIADIELFKNYPTYEKLEDIADYLGSTVNELFPEWLREQKLKKASYDTVVLVERLTLNAPEVNLLEAPDDMAEVIDKSFVADKVHEALENLTEREQKILKMYFGIDHDRSYSLEEVGDEFGVTRERVRQIQMKALNKLRQSKTLKEWKRMEYEQ